VKQVHARNKYFRSEEEKEALLKEIAELTEDFTGINSYSIYPLSTQHQKLEPDIFFH